MKRKRGGQPGNKGRTGHGSVTYLIKSCGLAHAHCGVCRPDGVRHGYRPTQATKDKIRASLMGKPWMGDRLAMARRKRELYQRRPELHPNITAGKLAHRGTVPEQQVEQVLIAAGILYERNKKVGPYWVDFVVGEVALEVDGDYWHRGRDHSVRDKFLEVTGYKVVRIPVVRRLTDNALANVLKLVDR